MLAVVAPWLLAPGEPLPVGLTSVLLVEGKLDVADEDADEGGVTGLELTDAGGDVATVGLTV